MFDSISRVLLFSTWLYVINDGQFSSTKIVIAYYTTSPLPFFFKEESERWRGGVKLPGGETDGGKHGDAAFPYRSPLVVFNVNNANPGKLLHIEYWYLLRTSTTTGGTGAASSGLSWWRKARRPPTRSIRSLVSTYRQVTGTGMGMGMGSPRRWQYNLGGHPPYSRKMALTAGFAPSRWLGIPHSWANLTAGPTSQSAMPII